MNLFRRWAVYEGNRQICRHWTPWGAHKCLIRRAVEAWSSGQMDGPEQNVRKA